MLLSLAINCLPVPVAVSSRDLVEAVAAAAAVAVAAL